ncbi:MAG: hypothetical protein JW896_15350 [Deltaproteobacteria bacterium]|nr:hypothetical protein [Deltaproteobacteria bacterium]
MYKGEWFNSISHLIGAALLFLIAVALAYRRFVLNLPFSTRLLFVLAGAIYILGALVFESISGKIAEISGESGFAYNAIVTLEEACEMLGVIIFILALLHYLAKHFGVFQISFRPFSK